LPVQLGEHVPETPEVQQNEAPQVEARATEPPPSDSSSPSDAAPADGGDGESSSGDRGRGRDPRHASDRSDGKGGRRNRRRRRGRKRKGDDPERGGSPSDSELMAGLPDDPEALMSMSRPLGLLEVLGSGSGFIRRRESGYAPGNDDIYVPSRMVQKYGLRSGDEMYGIVSPQARAGKSPPLAYLALVNDRAPEDAQRRPEFNRLMAMHPDEQLRLECGRSWRGEPEMTNRVIDLFCPFGKGQRAMIVAPAKAGKTMVMQSVAEGIVKNHPECHLLILLVDERPEEVTEMQQCGFGEVIASTFDRPAERHVQVAEMTLERARRRVEQGEDVVIILDSITRMARAYNTVQSGSGRTMSGGLDSNALEKPKRFLGSARKIAPDQGGGSLTIIATALVDTGSRMDQVIFEEFKGTGNSELVLSRELADRRVYPAIDLSASATRKEELLLDDDQLWVSHAMRRQLAGLQPTESMIELLGAMRKTSTNRDLIDWARNRS
jgi:transcription termination factor Rho